MSDKVIEINGQKGLIVAIGNAPITYPMVKPPFLEYLRRKLRGQPTLCCDCCRRWKEDGHKEGCANGNMWAEAMKWMQEHDLSWSSWWEISK